MNTYTIFMTSFIWNQSLSIDLMTLCVNLCRSGALGRTVLQSVSYWKSHSKKKVTDLGIRICSFLPTWLPKLSCIAEILLVIESVRCLSWVKWLNTWGTINVFLHFHYLLLLQSRGSLFLYLHRLRENVKWLHAKTYLAKQQKSVDL